MVAEEKVVYVEAKRNGFMFWFGIAVLVLLVLGVITNRADHSSARAAYAAENPELAAELMGYQTQQQPVNLSDNPEIAAIQAQLDDHEERIGNLELWRAEVTIHMASMDEEIELLSGQWEQLMHEMPYLRDAVKEMTLEFESWTGDTGWDNFGELFVGEQPN